MYFSAGRLLSYLALGLFVAYFGRILFNPYAAAVVIIPLGILLMLYGFLISFGTTMRYAWSICCHFRRVKSTFLLGIVLGLRPCIPLIAALTYSATMSSLPQALLFMASFWIGSTVYIPILGILAGTVTHFAVAHSNIGRVRRISGIALVVVGFIFANQGVAYMLSAEATRL
jgi:sulfite exporter TauE/SafE